MWALRSSGLEKWVEEQGAVVSSDEFVGFEFALIDVFELTSGDFGAAVGGIGVNVAVEGYGGGGRFGAGGEGGIGEGEVGEDGDIFGAGVGDVDGAGVGDRDALGGAEVAGAEGIERFAIGERAASGEVVDDRAALVDVEVVLAGFGGVDDQPGGAGGGAILLAEVGAFVGEALDLAFAR